MRHAGDEQWPEKENILVELCPVGQAINTKKKNTGGAQNIKDERRGYLAIPLLVSENYSRVSW